MEICSQVKALNKKKHALYYGLPPVVTRETMGYDLPNYKNLSYFTAEVYSCCKYIEKLGRKGLSWIQ